MARIRVVVAGSLVAGSLCAHICSVHRIGGRYSIGGHITPFVHKIAVAAICPYGMVGGLNAGRYSKATYESQQAGYQYLFHEV